jgi:hypothetical protein
METTAGAQAKANATQVYKLTQDNGYIIDSTAETDVNNLAMVGFYNTNNTAANLPTADYYKIITLNSSSTTITQIAIGNNTGSMYTRNKKAGVWGAWLGIQMYKLTQDNGQAQNTSAADANALTNSGLYTGSLSANAPEDDTSAINSLLVSANGNTVTQLSHRRYDNSLFFRSANAGVWTAWKKVATTDVAQMYKLTNDDGSMKIAITFFTDLNIIQTPGQWYISTAQTTNKPSGTTYGLLEVFLNGSTEILQRFTEMGSTSNGRQFFRQYTGTTWTSWVQLATDAINWKTPTLLNGWVNYGGSDEDASYEKTGNRVSLRGTIKSGTTAAGTVLFALPSGYRPAKNFYAMTICSGNNLVRIKVDLNGQVTLNSAPANNTWVQLDNISFVADGN